MAGLQPGWMMYTGTTFFCTVPQVVNGEAECDVLRKEILCKFKNLVEFQTLAELITKNKNSIQFGISEKNSPMSIFYGKITPRPFALLQDT